MVLGHFCHLFIQLILKGWSHPQAHPDGHILQAHPDCTILQIHPEHERSYLGTLILFKELQCFEFLKNSS